jgi:3-deoxy-7-phosphoheptulonate synthase
MTPAKRCPPAPPRTENLNVLELVPLITPRLLKSELPLTPKAARTVITARAATRAILLGLDHRLLVVVGPCSIHDPEATLEYARRLNRLRKDLADHLLILMRVYFEKPRTTTGWKGLIYDPHMDGSADIATGLRIARKLLLKINEMGLPTGSEMLDPIVPQYTADLVSWVAIGARTTESQTHRQMASGLSMPVGFKNRTDGNVQVAVDALEATRRPHSFLGMDDDGRVSIVRTAGNDGGHLILRGSGGRPNYDEASVADACARIQARSLRPAIVVDCSHGNAGKKFAAQEGVWNDVLRQRKQGNTSLVGMLVESNLVEGNQPIPDDLLSLRPGVSVTDECVGWATTERMLRRAARVMEKLRYTQRHKFLRILERNR